MARNIDTPTTYGGWEPADVDLSEVDIDSIQPNLSDPHGDSGFDLCNEETGEVIQLSNKMLADYLAAKANHVAHRCEDALSRLDRTTEPGRSIDLSTPDRGITFRQSPAEGSDTDLLRRWSEEG